MGTTKTKTPEEVKRWRSEQKTDGTNAMAEYKAAEGSARDRLAKLRTERVTREATAQPPKTAAPKPSAAKLSHAADRPSSEPSPSARAEQVSSRPA
jgi:hypothetical protein